MSGVHQVCPSCSWSRYVTLPQTADREFDDLITRHVARSLQWEWQVHAVDAHPMEAAAWESLSTGAYHDWVKGEGVMADTKETPPSKGGGQTVGVNVPTITPDQAKQLAQAVEHTLIATADQIQRFAEQMVPALHDAQETLTNHLRQLVEQRPGRTNICRCEGGHDAHEPGAPGCLFRANPSSTVNLTQLFLKHLHEATPQVVLMTAEQLREFAPFGVVSAELCSNCQRLMGEPHALPSCEELT